MGAYRLEFMVREDMKLMEIDDARCRVNYNCDFTLPTGLRGAILRRTFGRSFDTGPADSLLRLKREAERVYARSTKDRKDLTAVRLEAEEGSGARKIEG